MPARNPRNSVRSKKTNIVNFRRANSDSRLQRYAFVAIFALVGVIFAFYALAANATTTFSGSLNKKNPVRTHAVSTTASGTLAANGTSSTKGKSSGPSPLTLKLKTTGGTLIAEATGEPATISAPVGIGNYVIEVSSTSSSVNYTVSVSYPVADPTPISDTTAPTAPASLLASSASTSQVNLSWQSSTDNVGVTGYDVLRNGVKVSSTMTTTYNDVNLTPATTYSYTVKARDAAGNLSLASNTATATTQSTVDTTAPNISISSPTNGATVAGTVNITGSASDNAGINKVEVQVGANGFTPATITPGTSATNTTYSYSLNTTLFTDGTYTITVRATDTSGNQKTSSINITIKNNTSSPPSSAPETQGVWVSPEGVTIDVNTTRTNVNTGKLWTIADVYKLFLPEVANAGDFNLIAPNFTIKIQDVYAASATMTAQSSGGVFYKVRGTIYLGGSGTTSFWSSTPHSVVAHEYGHIWTYYYHYMKNNGSWDSYLSARGLLGDTRLETSYGWARAEIAADDYRLLLGSPAAISRNPSHMNSYIAEPSDVPGLRDFLLGDYRTQ